VAWRDGKSQLIPNRLGQVLTCASSCRYMAPTAVLLQRPAAVWLPNAWARPRYCLVVALYFLSNPVLSSVGIRPTPALTVAAMCVANQWRLRRD